MAMQDDLDRFVAGEGEDHDETLGEVDARGWDAEEANQRLRTLRRLQRQREDIAAVAAAELARITSWAEDRVAGIRKREEWYEQQLESWMRATERETGAKTVNLPNGDLRLRAGRERVDAGPTAVFELATMSNDEGMSFLRVEHRLEKAAVLARCEPGPVLDSWEAPDGFVAHAAVWKDAGQVLPDLAILVPTEPSFSVKVAGS